MARTRAPRKAYRPRTVRVPLTGLRDQIALQMRAALTCLQLAPSAEAFNSLAGIFNLVALAIEADQGSAHEARLICGGAAAMNQIESRTAKRQAPRDHEFAPIRVAVNAIDEVLPRLDVIRLELAQQRLRQIRTDRVASLNQAT